MKGGVTSGVVYSSAMQRLAKDWDFDSVAGSSAGAIAAAVGAACEYNRRRPGGNPNAFDALDAVVEDVKGNLFVEHLFQPTADARPGFTLALKLVASKKGNVDKGLIVLIAALRWHARYLVITVAAALAWVALLAVSAVCSATRALAITAEPWCRISSQSIVRSSAAQAPQCRAQQVPNKDVRLALLSAVTARHDDHSIPSEWSVGGRAPRQALSPTWPYRLMLELERRREWAGAAQHFA